MKTEHLKRIIKRPLLWLCGVLPPLLWVGVGGGLVSCADFLEVKQLDQIILEDFWTEKSDVDDVVTGCYVALQSSGVRERMMVWGEVRSDNIAAGENIDNNASLNNVVRENITAMNAYTTWDGFYNVINRCNTVLKYAQIVADADPSYTQGDLKATIAEVTALRCLSYFYLIRTFRNVPYSTVAFTDDDQVMDLPATPFNDVLDSLITDLERVKGDAVTRYPETEPREQTGRITRDAIHAMLCEMYLWKQDYDNCIKYAEMVIDSKKQLFEEEVNRSNNITPNTAQVLLQRCNGYPLQNDALTGTTFGSAYEKLFIEGNTDGYARETIFEIVYDNHPKTSGQTANSAVSYLYGNGKTPKGVLIASSIITEDIDKESNRTVYEDDNRKVDSRMYTNCKADGGNITKMATSMQIIDASKPAEPTSMAAYFDEDDNGSNWIIYRLSDIMLLEAEALCQKMREGSDDDAMEYNTPLLDKAFTLVNAINKRSICKPIITASDSLQRTKYNTKATMEKLVERERQRELMFEGKRYYDLVRYCLRDGNTDQMLSAIANRDNVNVAYAQNFFKKMDAIFWPYNYEEMRVNRNLVPNPAFGTGENESYTK